MNPEPSAESVRRHIASARRHINQALTEAQGVDFQPVADHLDMSPEELWSDSLDPLHRVLAELQALIDGGESSE